MERKEFLASLGLSAGALIVSCCLGGCSKDGGDTGPGTGGNPPPTPPPPAANKVDFSFDVSTDANMAARGWTTQNNVIIARNGAEYLAFESACPHQGSALTYNGAAKTFPCSNTTADHGSVFDAAGKKIAGPAPRDLKKYQTQLTGNSLRVYE